MEVCEDRNLDARGYLNATSRRHSALGLAFFKGSEHTAHPMAKVTFVILAALASLAARAAQASMLIPTIAMPANAGYAVDVKGTRHPAVECVRDAVFAPTPQFPVGGMAPGLLGDEWQSFIGRGGVFQLVIDTRSGRVVNVITVKSTGWKWADQCVRATLIHWAFKPSRWRTLFVTPVIRSEWRAIVRGRRR
jgi:hypothetical protein